jgi:hypothetical protein
MFTRVSTAVIGFTTGTHFASHFFTNSAFGLYLRDGKKNDSGAQSEAKRVNKRP